MKMTNTLKNICSRYFLLVKFLKLTGISTKRRVYWQGIVTAPLLFALEQQPQLHDLIGRKFKNAGDVDLVRL